jgi:uncharacterized protein YcfJ
MPQTVTIPGYDKPVDFPDSMSKEEIGAAAKKLYEAKKPKAPTNTGTGVMMGAPSGPAPAPGSYKAKEQAPLRERIASKASEALPAVGATLGAVAGGPIGAGIGGAAGTAAKDFANTGKVDPKNAAISGVANAAMEYVGGKMVPQALAKVAAKASPRAAEIVNNYLGLKSSSLPKFGRTIQNAREIGQTVLDKVGIKPTLEAQKAAIETTRQAYDDATKKIVEAPGGKLFDVHSALYDRAVKLLNDAEKEGVTKEQLGAIDKNLDSMLQASKPGGKMNPGEMHAMRKDIQKQITDWNPNTLNIRQRFLQGAYHDLNDSIARTLPPKEARQFLANNRIQSRLITARNAADATILKESERAKPGLVTKAARVAGGAAVGGTIGGVAGEEGGHGKEGALTGAILGAAAGAGYSAVNSINLPAKDVAASRILSSTASKLAKVSKATPQVVRTLDAIRAVQTRPQQ